MGSQKVRFRVKAPDVPTAAAGGYAVSHDDGFFYCGMSGRGIEQAPTALCLAEHNRRENRREFGSLHEKPNALIPVGIPHPIVHNPLNPFAFTRTTP